jgi:hypothetical protein
MCRAKDEMWWLGWDNRRILISGSTGKRERVHVEKC